MNKHIIDLAAKTKLGTMHDYYAHWAISHDDGTDSEEFIDFDEAIEEFATALLTELAEKLQCFTSGRQAGWDDDELWAKSEILNYLRGK